jgi:hypothetical protein
MAMDKDMDISMDIHEKSVDMDVDVDYQIHGNPGKLAHACRPDDLSQPLVVFVVEVRF